MELGFNPFSLEGKNILITGASSGIGRQCAIDCSKMGANVVLIGRNLERLKETYQQLEGTTHLILPFDLTETESIGGIIKETVGTIGKLNGVLHCAGISGIIPLKLSKIQEMKRYMLTNVFSGMELTKEVLKKGNFSGEGGSVVFLASVMGVVGEKAKFIYSMTKGALIAASKSLSLEYASRKIRINCISPGVIETPINSSQPYLADPEKRKITEEKHPLGVGKTTDISHAAIYLLSDASRWITGQNLIVDGGYTIY